MYPTCKTSHSRKAACAVVIQMYIKAIHLLCIFAISMAAEATPQPDGKWQILAAPSTPEESIALSLKAEKPVAVWMKTAIPTLVIECNKGKPAIYVDTGVALEVTQVDQQIVRIQLDGNKPTPQRWREVANAAVSASTRDATALIKQLTQSRKLLFTFNPFNSPATQVEFAVNGLSAYSSQLDRACWRK